MDCLWWTLQALVSIVVLQVVMMMVSDDGVLQLAMADDHIVGANHGWQVPAEAGMEMDVYSHWAAQHTFYLGDFISFHYQKGLHTVYEVNNTVYESCDFGSLNHNSNSNISHAVNNGADIDEERSQQLNMSNYMSNVVVHDWSTKGGRSIVPLNQSRVYYFACGVGDHCQQGMKVAVSVLPLARPSSSAPSSSSSSSASASAPSSSPLPWLLLLVPLSTFFIIPC